jgi:hypothetical protein
VRTGRNAGGGRRGTSADGGGNGCGLGGERARTGGNGCEQGGNGERMEGYISGGDHLHTPLHSLWAPGRPSSTTECGV